MDKSKKSVKKRLSLTLVILLLLAAAALIRTPDTNRDDMLNKYGNQYSTQAAIYDDNIITDKLVDQFWALGAIRKPGERVLQHLLCISPAPLHNHCQE